MWKSVDVACDNTTCDRRGEKRTLLKEVGSLSELAAGTKVDETCRVCNFDLAVILSAPRINTGGSGDTNAAEETPASDATHGVLIEITRNDKPVAQVCVPPGIRGVLLVRETQSGAQGGTEKPKPKSN